MTKRAHSVIQRHFAGIGAGLLLAWITTASPALAQQTEPADNVQDNPEGAAASETGDPASRRYLVSSGPDDEEMARRWPDRAIWLEPEEGPRALALFTREQEQPVRGALLVLANEGDTAAAGMAGALHEPMALSGWAVMSLGLPRLPVAVEYSRRHGSLPGSDPAGEGGSTEEAPAPAGDQVMINVIEAASAESLEKAYRQRVSEHLNAAMQRLVSEGYDRIALVGLGRSAGHVTRFAVSGAEVTALVWIAPEFSGTAEPVNELLAGKGSWRLLDLYNPGPEASRRARERQAIIERAGIGGYRRINVVAGDPPRAGQARAVAGVLSASLAPGP